MNGVRWPELVGLPCDWADDPKERTIPMNGSKSWAIPNERGQDSPAASLITVGTLAVVLVLSSTSRYCHALGEV